MADVEIEIDGKKLTAQPNQTVIQVADEAGIYIPRFCYHKHLTIPANCRMCLVEVEKMPKAVPACATPVMPGMKIFTKSPKTVAAQRAVMEFLLINHPLDCPICDQGGECELQDLSMGYGSSHSEYDEPKHCVADENLGPLIATEMTRCIKCTRCVRFGDEIAGLRELGVLSRGENSDISTYVQHAMKSEVSGNIIDLCPVGALTSKPYRFTARAWELDQSPAVSPHDCVGSNLHIHTRYGKVMRAVSRENAAINQTWIADRDRFSYTGLYHPDRLEEPAIRENGQWRIATWQEALEFAAKGLKEVIQQHGADQIGALASPNSTLEEFYLLQKLMRALGSSHIDHRLREVDTQDQASLGLFPSLDLPIAELENCDAILLIGSHIQKEQPLLSLRVRQAALKGATIIVVNPVDYPFNFPITHKIIVAPPLLAEKMASLQDHLKNKNKIAILLGAIAAHAPNASLIRAQALTLAQSSGAKIGYLTSGANSAGGWIAGAIPHRQAGGVSVNPEGLNAANMLAKPRKAYLLLNVEPALDCAQAHQATQALKQGSFVVSLSMYRDPHLAQCAHVILPIAAFTETHGTYVNANGLWQSFNGLAAPFAASRPAWKVLRVLANFLQLDHFDYESADAIRAEVKALVDKNALNPVPYKPESAKTASGLSRIGEIPIYALDSLVRRAKPLQAAQRLMEGSVESARLHSATAEQLKLKAGDLVQVKQESSESVEMKVEIDDRIAPDAVWLAGGIESNSRLGGLFGPIEIEKI